MCLLYKQPGEEGYWLKNNKNKVVVTRGKRNGRRAEDIEWVN